MKQRFLQIITSILLIVTLTMANFLLLCVDVVSYAADAINGNSSTNHKNIEFRAYLKNDEGDKVSNLDITANKENVKLYLQIALKNQGYFNGSITLDEANFKLIPENNSSDINKIEGNTIYLNQINAGESKELEIGIEILKDEQFDLSLINMESKITLNGIYRDSTEKDIKINSTKNIKLMLIAPYDENNNGSILEQDVITNKVLNYNGEEKRVIQIKVNSGIEGNLFPIKASSLEIMTPKISDKYPEAIYVDSINEMNSTGNKISENDWNYDSTNGILYINLKNEPNENRVKWIKDGKDEIIVTYIFSDTNEMQEQVSKVKSEVKLYDIENTAINSSNEIKFNGEEKDSTITLESKQYEGKIYKGKLYAGISRDITYKTIVNVNLINTTDSINVIEEKETIEGENLSSNIDVVYKNTRIKKSQIEDILGQDGIISIINSENGAQITTISSETETDENGYINIVYSNNIKQIEIKTTKPKKVGKIEIETTKTINNINSNSIRKGLNLKYSVNGKYIVNSQEKQIQPATSYIELQETETSADLEISKNDFSAMTTNENVEFRITLNSRNENNELFKNPVLNLELPEKFQDIQVNSINLIYEDEMRIKSANLVGNNIQVVLEGEQTKYKEQAIDGAIIIINANLTTSKKIASSNEQVKLTYTNAKAINYKDGANIGTDIKDINIVSYAGVVATNQISEYGIELVNNEGIKEGRLQVSADTKNATIKKEIINNKGNKITNVKILGVFPTKYAVSDVNNIDILINSGIAVSGIDASRAKVYYSNNTEATEDINDVNNGWMESIPDSKDVKKYLVVIDGLDVLEEVDLEYGIVIPSDLEYNESAEEGYNVYYDDVITSVSESVSVYNLRLSTDKGATAETSLSAFVGGKESQQVKQGEVVKYAVTVSNTGSEDINSIMATGKVPEGTTYVEVSPLPNDGEKGDNYNPYIENKEIDTVQFNFENLKQGETKTQYYLVKVDEDTQIKTISNKVAINYGDVTKESNEVVNSIEESDVRVSIFSVEDEGIVQSGYGYRYIANVRNSSNKSLKNVKVEILKDDLMKINSLMYLKNDGTYVEEKENNYIVIEEIPAQGYVDISINSMIDSFSNQEKRDMNLLAIASINNKEYYSNELDLLAQSVNLSFNISSENSGNYVKAGDNIEYKVSVKNNGNNTANNIEIQNTISRYTTLVNIKRNGQELGNERYNIDNQNVLRIQDNIEANENIEYIITVAVNSIPRNDEALEISNIVKIGQSARVFVEETIKHIMEPEEDIDNEDDYNEDDYTDEDDDGNDNFEEYDENEKDDNDDDKNNDDKNDENDKNDNVVKKVISGTAWLDENNNGQKDSNEQLLSGINVKLLDTQSKKIVTDSNGKQITAVTNGEGFYSLNSVPQGEYIVIFEYDTAKYILTAYQKEGVSEQNNSKVISRVIDIENEQKTVGSTEIIKIENSNIGNVNIGLQEAKIFDLKLEKFVSRVVVQNSNGTETKDYNDETLAKAEIHAKLVNSTTVVVEYTIRVTNEGEVEGYVKKIADYLSKDYKFSSELNKDWYQSGNDVYNTSLANEKILPGQSKEIKLIVTKQMNESNTGLITNTAEIIESYNELGIPDTDSLVANKVKDEDDMGVADLILGIKTGEIVATVLLSILAILILSVCAFVIVRKILKRNIL